jgi:predicted nucleic acid-binding protein
MRTLIFDTSAVISLAMNNLLWLLKPMKQQFNGEFYVPEAVRYELVDKPFSTMKYKLEAIMVNKVISDSDLLTYEKLNVDDLSKIFNSLYLADSKPIHIVDTAEIEAFALALRLQSEAYVVDERTMRLLIEDPNMLQDILSRKLERKVEINKTLLKELKDITKGVKVIRSSELVTIAYEKGLLNQFITENKTSEDLVEALLWALRLRGCAISTDEINDLIRYEIR